MIDELIESFKEDFSLLIESGFIAVKQTDEVSAMRIFQAAQTLSPKNTAPQIGMGFIAINKMEIKKATQIYESVIEQEPDNHLAQTFLGICYLLTKGKQKKGLEVINAVLEKNPEQPIKDLAAMALQWNEKDLAKKISKSPFFDQPEKES